MTTGVPDATYAELFTRFVSDPADPSSFFAEFWRLYSSDERVDDDERFEILQRVFYAMEDFEPDPEQRDESSVLPDQVHTVVKEALRDLTHRKTDYEGSHP